MAVVVVAGRSSDFDADSDWMMLMFTHISTGGTPRTAWTTPKRLSKSKQIYEKLGCIVMWVWVSVCLQKIVIFSIFKYILPFCIIFANPLKLDMGISVVDSFFMLFFPFFNDGKRIE